MSTTFAFQIAAVTVEDDEADPHASLDRYGFPDRIGGQASNRIFATILKYQLDSLGQAVDSFSLSPALAVCPGNFRAVSEIPIAVTLNDRSKFACHYQMLPVGSSLREAYHRGARLSFSSTDGELI
jgi:hypothetical protein